MQSGLYHGHLGALREVCQGMIREVFSGKAPRAIATGGFAHLFRDTGLFGEIVPDLVLRGLLTALEMND